MNTATAADGTALSWRRAGRKGATPLLLVHSLAMAAPFWDRVIQQLGEQFDIVVPDCRGHGMSGRVPGPYSVEQFADDLATVLDAAEVERPVVAGCSMGGCVALAFAIRHAARVLALGLIDTTAWYGADAPEAWRGRAEQGLQKGLASLVGFQTTRWFSDAFRAAEPELVQQLVDIFVANEPACYAAACNMLGAADLRTGLPGITVPTAVLVGAEDYATPPDMALALATGIAGATLEIIDDGRHLTPVQCPERIATLLRGLAARI
jgi:3-oxoadipate enol-lactonase